VLNRAAKTPIPDPALRFAAGKHGMRLLLVSLGMLFAASMLMYMIVRVQSPEWPPRGMPPLPPLLIVSTMVLLVSSATMQWAVASARCDRPAATARAMAITSLLAVIFLALQALAWIEMILANLDIHDHLYAFTFYVLTALHALHVVGGLGPMFIVTARAFRGRYSSRDYAALVYCAMYWHFLGAVWLVLYATLLVGTYWGA
jgi:cytochrome c oxidase subunit 3